jgi:DNA processing protein
VTGDRACPRCLARSWLLGRLAGHLDPVRARIEPLLALADQELIAAVAGHQRDDVRRELAGFTADRARAGAAAAGLEQICRCHPGYPAGLAALAAPPAVLHVTGSIDTLLQLIAEYPVAVVGARRASPYGVGVARSLARGLASAGLTVVSGMARGIDAAAHAGALDAPAPTIAVLPSGADRPYPATARALHRRIVRAGAAVSELGPGIPVRRWMFPARNRIIAGLGAMTVVVQARPGSGALLTADYAAGLGRPVGAVPGQITSPLAAGPHELLRAGAQLVQGPQDVLDGLFGVGVRSCGVIAKPALAPELQALLDGLADGHEPGRAFAQAGLDTDRGLAALAALELAGRVRREPGGRFSIA